MVNMMKGSWVPVASFALALALSWVAGIRHHPLFARQSSGSTGCECKFKVLSQTGKVEWKTEGKKNPVLVKLKLDYSATVCVSSEPPGLFWAANWKATNLLITYTVHPKGFPKVDQVNETIPIHVGGVFGPAPCKPETQTLSSNPSRTLAEIKESLETDLRLRYEKKYPAGTEVKVLVHAVAINPTINTELTASGPCGKQHVGPLAMSVATFTPPQNNHEGSGQTTLPTGDTCP